MEIFTQRWEKIRRVETGCNNFTANSMRYLYGLSGLRNEEIDNRTFFLFYGHKMVPLKSV